MTRSSGCCASRVRTSSRCRRRTDRAAVETLGARLGMEVVYGEANSEFAVAWLSRVPVARAENHRLPVLEKTLLEIEVDGRRLFATHLSAGRTRADEPQAGRRGRGDPRARRRRRRARRRLQRSPSRRRGRSSAARGAGAGGLRFAPAGRARPRGRVHRLLPSAQLERARLDVPRVASVGSTRLRLCATERARMHGRARRRLPTTSQS